MRTFHAIIERDLETGLLVGHVPGWPGAHSQAESLQELRANLHLDDGGVEVLSVWSS